MAAHNSTFKHTALKNTFMLSECIWTAWCYWRSTRIEHRRQCFETRNNEHTYIGDIWVLVLCQWCTLIYKPVTMYKILAEFNHTSPHFIFTTESEHDHKSNSQILQSTIKTMCLKLSVYQQPINAVFRFLGNRIQQYQHTTERTKQWHNTKYSSQ